MNDLLQQFGDIIFTVNFLWVVIAATVTMEVLKWTVLPKDTNSSIYPYTVLVVCLIWVLLKTAFVGDWRELASNLIFTTMMADVFYTYLGKYIIQSIIWLFKSKTGSVNQPPPQP